MTNRRRLARDQGLEQPINAEQAIETIQQIFDGLEDDQAADLVTLIEQRLDNDDPAAQDKSFRRGPRRARDRRVPGAARDRRRPAMDTAGLPSFEELFPGVNRRKVW